MRENPLFQPPAGWQPDPDWPGWYRDPNGDAGEDSSWWQAPPADWIEDPEWPGWLRHHQGDAGLSENWWFGGRTQKPAAPTNWYDPVFARARELYGKTPYVFGGDRQPGVNESGGWDCIGFVMECLDAATPPLGGFGLGIHQGYINADRARQACAMVPKGQEQTGDLIFFQGTYNTPGASHVGLVIDPTNTLMADDVDRGDGTGPGQSNYSSSYWKAHFMQFGRVPR